METTEDESYRRLKLQTNGQRRWKLQTMEATDNGQRRWKLQMNGQRRWKLQTTDATDDG